MVLHLRDYQSEDMEKLREGFRSFRRQIYVLPTGAGKTVTFAFITKRTLEKGLRTVILAHRSEILGQISKTLSTVDVPHRMLKAGMHTPRNAGVVVASVQTLVRRLDEFAEPDLVVVDECFPAGTIISTPSGDRPIEQIKPGDPVWTYNGAGSMIVEFVVRTMQRRSFNQVRLNAGDFEVQCTEDHPILTNRVLEPFVPANQITKHDNVAVYRPGKADWSPCKVSHRCDVLDGGMVFNLETTGSHTYIANGIVVHNCHHAAATTWATIFGKWATARFLGVTATPQRLDGRGLGDFFENMIVGPSVAWLTENKYLAPAVYFGPKNTPDTSRLHHVAGDFNRKEAGALMDRPSITGDAVQQYRKRCDGQKFLAFCVNIAHAEHMAAQFRGAGIPCKSIDGTMNDEERSGILDALRAGELLGVTSCELLSEGFDVPTCSVAILSRPTESLALAMQQLGRVLRPKPDGGFATVLDQVDNIFRHGMADEPREWTLAGNPRTLKGEALPSVRRCSYCFAIFKGQACPSCGAPYKPRERDIQLIDGDLEQIDPAKLAEARARKVDRQISVLTNVGRSRGFRDPAGWARHVLAAKEQKERQKAKV